MDLGPLNFKLTHYRRLTGLNTYAYIPLTCSMRGASRAFLRWSRCGARGQETNTLLLHPGGDRGSAWGHYGPPPGAWLTGRVMPRSESAARRRNDVAMERREAPAFSKEGAAIKGQWLRHSALHSPHFLREQGLVRRSPQGRRRRTTAYPAPSKNRGDDARPPSREATAGSLRSRRLASRSSEGAKAGVPGAAKNTGDDACALSYPSPERGGWLRAKRGVGWG